LLTKSTIYKKIFKIIYNVRTSKQDLYKQTK